MVMAAGEMSHEEQGVLIGLHRYVRAPQPLVFPEHEQVPETKWHLELKTLVYQFLQLAFGDRAHIGCDQFVYWDAANPRVCLAPDAFVRLGGPDELFGSWKVWERGAPHVAVEIISNDDARDRYWEPKLNQYRQLGVQELVRFDPEAAQHPLRIWDRLDNDLVERKPSPQPARSNVLPGFWATVQDPKLGPSLRLSHDESGAALYPTPVETAATAAARVRELEAELARRQG
jgi:Uma2 family endonuclease